MAATAISMRRCRVTYVAIHAAAGLAGIEVPATFVTLLSSGGQVAGLSVGMPFEVLPAGTTVEFDFWGTVVERPLTGTPTADQAERYRRTGVPLRSRVMTATPPTAPLVTRPRVEILFNPTTVTCLVTMDLAWPNGVDAMTAQQALDAIEKTSVTAAVGARAVTSPLADLATTVCDALVALLTVAPPVRMPRRRFCTVIDGDVSLSTPPLPPAGPLHQELHLLARGPSGALSPIPNALVPRWSGAGFVWPSAVLTYVLDRGAAALALDAVRKRPAPPSDGVSTANRHRELVLIWAHVGASAAACVLAAAGNQTAYVRAGARDAANRIGRLWGPAAPGDPWWGVEMRYLLDPGARAAVETVLTTKLFEAQPLPAKYP